MPTKRSITSTTKSKKTRPAAAIAKPPIKPAAVALAPHQEYSLLGLPDLLTARDKNHLELMRKKNVVGTAVGYYLIRNSDPWPKSGHVVPPSGPKPPRTLGNSSLRPYSWPCIL